MTEIPLPPDEYSGVEPEKKGGFCKNILIIAVILMIVVGAVVGFTMFSDGPTTTTTQQVNWDSRDIADWNNVDIETSDTVYYRNQFTVSSYETETDEIPYVQFEISIDDMGADTGTVGIHVAIYQTTMSVVDDAATWSELDTYLVGEGDYSNSVNAYADLETYSDTYTWVVWFEYSGKTDTWVVDLLITLNYAYYV
ncbi:MAG: hypothetical protein EAX95_07095 [Candidatus Thorarchaeota archaeon]|nr:hypothetical protein [Candidatus Thorarchaeota archaeon]